MTKILFAKKEYINQVKNLWMKSFGDSQEYIDFFFEQNNLFDDENNSKNKVAVYIIDNKVVSMVCIMECTMHYKKVLPMCYLFSVATDIKYRSQGLMRQLESFVIDYLTNIGVQYVFLVPSNNTLFNMYQKLGYKTAFYIGKHTINITNNHKKNIAKISSIDKNDFIVMRDKYYSSLPLSVKLKSNFIFNESKFEKSYMCKILSNNYNGYIIGSINKNELNIIESNLSLNVINNLSNNLSEYFNVSKITLINHEHNNIPYGCYKSLLFEDVIENNKGFMNLMLL